MTHRLLIIDDESSIRDGLKEAFMHFGFTVRTAANGESAIDMLGQEKFDIIITDIVMDGVDGIEVLKYAKQSNPAVKVIILTGFIDAVTAINAVKFKADDFFVKPTQFNELHQSVLDCLNIGFNQPRAVSMSYALKNIG